jgi:2-methylcitrate dehydratase
VSAREAERFLDVAQDLPKLPAGELHRLNVVLPNGALEGGLPGIL